MKCLHTTTVSNILTFLKKIIVNSSATASRNDPPLHPKTKNKQESPPAWTQEAYRPQRIKYSICCPILEGGYLPLPGGIYLGVPPPPPVLAWPGGGTYLGQEGGTYLGVPPILTWLGGEVPTLGYPLPPSGPGQGTSPPPSGPGRVPPPPPPVWTDWKHYLPHPSDAVGKNAAWAIIQEKKRGNLNVWM